jgi:hypothetical protein
VKEFFAGVDSADQSFTMPFNEAALPVFLRLFEKYAASPNIPELVEALAIRYEEVYRATKNHTGVLHRPESIEEAIIFSATELDLTLQELVAIPEQDDWTYETHRDGHGYTSAEFVIAAYQQLGLFDGYEVNASEFTVQDVVELQIFDSQFQRPDQCAEADIHLAYCQLMGETRLWLKNYNTKKITSQMNESCPNPFLHRFNASLGC